MLGEICDGRMPGNKFFIRPDHLLILLPPFEECVRRWAKRGHQEILEEESFQKKVYENYQRYAAEHGIETIDTSREKAEVAEIIYSRIQ